MARPRLRATFALGTALLALLFLGLTVTLILQYNHQDLLLAASWTTSTTSVVRAQAAPHEAADWGGQVALSYHTAAVAAATTASTATTATTAVATGKEDKLLALPSSSSSTTTVAPTTTTSVAPTTAATSVAATSPTTPTTAATSAATTSPTTTTGSSSGNMTLAERVRNAPRFRGEFLVLALTNAGNLNLTINWLASLYRVGLSVQLPLIVCTDTVSYDYLHNAGLNAFYLSDAVREEIGWPVPAYKMQSDWQLYRSAGYGILVKVKFGLSAYILYKLGVPTIFSDVDLVLLRREPVNAFDNMVDRLNEAEKTMGVSLLMQADFPTELCTGLYIARPSQNVSQLFEEVDRALHVANNNINQKLFTKICVDKFDCLNTFVRMLPYDPPSTYLPGSHIFLENFQPLYQSAINSNWAYGTNLTNGGKHLNIEGVSYMSVRSSYDYPFTAHANFLVGKQKFQRLVAYKLWWIDDVDMLQRAGLPLPQLLTAASSAAPMNTTTN